jgi:hydrogenase maturation protease
MSRVVVLGAGNPLMGDEGVGVLAAESLEGRVPPRVEVLPAGALAATLLPLLEGVTHLLVLDAVDAGLAPGAIVRLHPEAAPWRPSLSAHDFGVPDLLVLLEHEGRAPERVLVLGVQPGPIGPGTELSPEVRTALPRLVDAALEVLDGWLERGRPPLRARAERPDPPPP